MISAIISFVVLALFALVVWNGLRIIFSSSAWIIVLFFVVFAILIAYVIWTERRK